MGYGIFCNQFLAFWVFHCPIHPESSVESRSGRSKHENNELVIREEEQREEGNRREGKEEARREDCGIAIAIHQT